MALQSWVALFCASGLDGQLQEPIQAVDIAGSSLAHTSPGMLDIADRSAAY